MFGLTWLNAYAGMASGHVIYDDYELALSRSGHLPGPLDPRTIYLTFQGTDAPVNAGPEGPLFGHTYLEAPTEIIAAGSTEVWEILNLTGDTHPIHFHLVNVQVLSRQVFDAPRYVGGPPATRGRPSAPDERTRLEGDGPDEPG